NSLVLVFGEDARLSLETAGEARAIVTDHVCVALLLPESALVIRRVEATQQQRFDVRCPRLVQEVGREAGAVHRPRVARLVSEALRQTRLDDPAAGSRDGCVVHAHVESTLP